MNTCDLDGYLVNGRSVLPTDPTDFNIEGLPTLGCSRLRCARCKARVRNAVGLAFRTRSDDVDLNRLYETYDLATSPALHQTEPAFRLYVCRCERWLETSERALSAPDPDTFTDPSMPWRCDQHPLIELPDEIDGAWIGNQDELFEIANRVFHGWNPPGARRADSERAAWACRLHERLAPADAAAVARATAACMDDPEASVRGRALAFCVRIPVDVAMQRALSLLEGDRRLFARVPDEITEFGRDYTLEDTLWRAVAPLVGMPGRAQNLARTEALAAGKGSRALYDALAAGDSDWVTAHVEDMARATPDKVEDLFHSFWKFPKTTPTEPGHARLAPFMPKSGSGRGRGGGQ